MDFTTVLLFVWTRPARSASRKKRKQAEWRRIADMDCWMQACVAFISEYLHESKSVLLHSLWFETMVIHHRQEIMYLFRINTSRSGKQARAVISDAEKSSTYRNQTLKMTNLRITTLMMWVKEGVTRKQIHGCSYVMLFIGQREEGGARTRRGRVI